MPRAKKTYRRANGDGTVYNLGGNRRKPWVAKYPIKTEYAPELKRKYRQVYKTIGYFKSKDEAQIALIQYRKSPQAFDKSERIRCITFEEVYKEWIILQERKSLTDKTTGLYAFGFNLCKSIHDSPLSSLKANDFQRVIDDCALSYASKSKIKQIMVAVCNHAEKNDIVKKNYAKFAELGSRSQSTMHQPFTSEEIQTLWDNIEMKYVDTILMMIYSGYRVNELLKMKSDNVDLEKKIFIAGLKTKAGKNRIVPIHEKIFPLVKCWYKENDYLIRTQKEKHMPYDIYRKAYFDKIMDRLGMKHLPHDCRHTFATLLNNADANSTSIKKLIGHSSFELTEKVYSHKDVDELRKAIDKL